jgi:hypothetical protein
VTLSWSQVDLRSSNLLPLLSLRFDPEGEAPLITPHYLHQSLDLGYLIRLQRIHNFWCSMLVLHHLFSVLLHFVAFLCIFRTNLLTRCHSASSLFSAVFVFQKSYTGNILGIGRNQTQTSRYFTELPEDRRGDGAGPEGGHTTKGRGPPLARIGLWCGPPGPLLTPPLHL